jgi:hypothetical protein
MPRLRLRPSMSALCILRNPQQEKCAARLCKVPAVGVVAHRVGGNSDLSASAAPETATYPSRVLGRNSAPAALASFLPPELSHLGLAQARTPRAFVGHRPGLFVAQQTVSIADAASA